MTKASFNTNPDLYPDPTGRAERVCKFISNLTLWEDEWAGKKFKVHPFQEAIIRRIYGPVDGNGRRIVRTVFIWIPRGNAKTTLAAGLALGHFLGPEAVAGGQIICAAADRTNAVIAFNMASKMVQQDDVLESRVRPLESQKSLFHNKNDSVLKAISTEAYSKHGMNVSLFLADEIHSWPETEAKALYTAITDSMVKRREPLTIIISTAGEGDGGWAREMWDYSHGVATGEIIDPTCASIIFEADPADDWKIESTWLSCNPGMQAGFLYKEGFEGQIAKAAHFPNLARDFQRFKLNIWQSGSSTPWLNMEETYDKADVWAFTPEQQKEMPAYVGIDLASVEDLTAVVIAIPDDEEDEEERGFDILPHFFLPSANIDAKSDLDKAKYVQWAKNGYLTLTEGNRTDQKTVLAYVEKIKKEYNIGEDSIGIDRWNTAGFTAMANEKEIELIEFGQGFVSMAAPVKSIKSCILGGKFRHGGNPILRMCFANVVTEKDAAENEKFTKAKARGRIDGATASAMAIGRYLATKAERDEEYKGIFSKKSDYRKGYGRKEPEPEPELYSDGLPFSYQVLADMKHPLFEEHKKKFERWQDGQNRRAGAGWAY